MYVNSLCAVNSGVDELFPYTNINLPFCYLYQQLETSIIALKSFPGDMLGHISVRIAKGRAILWRMVCDFGQWLNDWSPIIAVIQRQLLDYVFIVDLRCIVFLHNVICQIFFTLYPGLRSNMAEKCPRCYQQCSLRPSWFRDATLPGFGTQVTGNSLGPYSSNCLGKVHTLLLK